MATDADTRDRQAERRDRLAEARDEAHADDTDTGQNATRERGLAAIDRAHAGRDRDAAAIDRAALIDRMRHPGAGPEAAEKKPGEA
ncbi:MAG: hypothetical protein ABIM89_14080 [Mycobacteriales bacterium]